MNYYTNKIELISPVDYYHVLHHLEISLDKLKYTSCNYCFKAWVEDHKNCVCPCTCFEFKFLVDEFKAARAANKLLDKSELLNDLKEERAKILFNPNRINKLINEFGFEILDTLE